MLIKGLGMDVIRASTSADELGDNVVVHRMHRGQMRTGGTALRGQKRMVCAAVSRHDARADRRFRRSGCPPGDRESAAILQRRLDRSCTFGHLVRMGMPPTISTPMSSARFSE